MVVATEELSRGSLGAGGSLITRPEILARALLAGGTEEQKHEWLPQLAAAEVMNAVAVTEPDFGSDVAGVKVTATPTPPTAPLADQRREDVVHVRRPRRRADAAGPHRPRPLEGPPGPVAVHRARSRAATATASSSCRRLERGGAGGGKMEGRPIDTIGYRGMHSYEIAFDNWFVPADNLIGGEDGHGPRLLLPDGRVRERPAADRGPRRRRHAGRLRGGPPVRRTTASCSASRSPTTS